MHLSSIKNLENFFKVYLKYYKTPKIIDIGGRVVSGQLSAKYLLKKFNLENNYSTADVVNDTGVDIYLKNPYNFKNIKENSYDIVISTSTFEHAEFFWLTYLEILKILKPSGVFYLNAPSNGDFHRYPRDYWRFYPDSGQALVNWGNYNGYRSTLLESFISKKILPEYQWNDFVAVILKNNFYQSKFKKKIMDIDINYYNGLKKNKIYNFSKTSEDQSDFGFKISIYLRWKILKMKNRIKKKTLIFKKFLKIP